jgi:hypothetical protein
MTLCIVKNIVSDPKNNKAIFSRLKLRTLEGAIDKQAGEEDTHEQRQ